MPFAKKRFFNRQSSGVRYQCIILLLLVLPLTACGRYRAHQALRRAEYFAEILRREGFRTIGEDGFLRNNLLRNQDPQVRQWCAIALGRIADPRGLPILYDALVTGDAEVRAASAFAIGEIEYRERVDTPCSVPDPRAALELSRLLDDPSISVRMRAIEALGKTGSRAEAAPIIRRLERLSCGGSASGKAYLETGITALARLGDPAAIPFLDQLAGACDSDIQSRAVEASLRIKAKSTEMRSLQIPDTRPAAPCVTNSTTAPEPESGSITAAAAMALAAFRKNSTIAQIETTRGMIEIELFREDAPVTVDRFVSMAKRGVYNDTEFTKDAPFQVIEGGASKKFPGLSRSILSEVNMRPFDRGRIGLATAGSSSDVGKFFITLAPQPYLDGINTCFGHVVSGMQIADRLTSGDRIRRITIKETVHFHDYQRY